MFIGIPDSIRKFVKDVSPQHWRVQAVVVESKSSRTLVINSYFPTDSREINNRGDNLELTETIEVIKTVIEDNQCEAIVWAGDVNADLEQTSDVWAEVRLVTPFF